MLGPDGTNYWDNLNQSDYVWLNGQPIALIYLGQIYPVHNDHLGRPDVLNSTSQQIIWRAVNQAFTTTNDRSGPGLMFPGQFYDWSSTLYYNWNRYYDSSIGRYTQSDPIGLAGGLNTYAYVGGNPVSFVDPLGLDLTPAQQAAVVAAANDWSNSNVPYVFGGSTKEGADCSGSVSGVYKQAGIDIGRMSSRDFKNSPLFSAATGAPQIGDVGVYPGHVDIYGGSTGTGKDVWSASHTGGPVFGPANSSWYGTPTWYRYNGGQ